MRRVFLTAAIVAVVGSAAAEAQRLKMQVPSGLTLSTANEPAPKKESKADSKRMFKDLRPGSCRVTTNSAPGSSWPARGEPLIAFCRP